MPLTSSAKKALNVSRKKYLKNQEIKKKLKEAIKKTSEKNINTTFSLIDKAAKNNIIHKNKAARLKSVLAKKIGKTPKAEKKTVKPQKKTINKSVKKQTKVKNNK